MGWWTDIRDTAEAAGSIAGNYMLPGSGLITSQLVSEGAKEKLGSDLGRLAMLGSGVGGGMEGNMSNWNPDTWSASTDLGTSNAGYDQTGLEGGVASANTAPTLGSSNTLSAGTNLGNADKAALYGTEGYGPAASPTEMATYPGTTPSFLQALTSGNFGQAAGQAADWIGKNPIPAMYVGGSLYDMYAKNQMAKKQEALYNQNRADIMNTYAPNSPEYNMLKQEMARKDAAAGRNSQYGIRANDLAATIAKLKMNAIGGLQQGQNALFNQGLGNQYGMFNTPMALAMYSQRKGG